MESMQRDGLLPKHTNEEIVARYEEISGTKLTKPLINVPLKLTQEVSTHDISAAVSEQIETNKEGQQTHPFNESLYETEDFSIGDVPDEKPLEDRIFQRKKDTLVTEVSMLEDEDARSALIKAYKTLPESLWGSSSARALYNANLKKE
jgi:chromosome condensin MukBEF complex kleisin-like MukF subunit